MTQTNPRRFCRNGHEYTDENTRLTVNQERRCITCERNQRQRSKPQRAEYARKFRVKHLKGLQERGKKFYQNNKEKKLAQNRKSRLWALYRLTPEDFDAMMTYQGGVCAVSKKAPVNKKLNIDHRHKDGLIRGLLSMSINKGLAYFNDDPQLLRAAADYLENPPAIRALGEARYGLIGKAQFKKKMKYGPLVPNPNQESNGFKSNQGKTSRVKTILRRHTR